MLTLSLSSKEWAFARFILLGRPYFSACAHDGGNLPCKRPNMCRECSRRACTRAREPRDQLLRAGLPVPGIRRRAFHPGPCGGRAGGNWRGTSRSGSVACNLALRAMRASCAMGRRQPRVRRALCNVDSSWSRAIAVGALWRSAVHGEAEVQRRFCLLRSQFARATAIRGVADRSGACRRACFVRRRGREERPRALLLHALSRGCRRPVA